MDIQVRKRVQFIVYLEVRKFIKDNEPQAFVIVNDAHDVLGKGFGDIE